MRIWRWIIPLTAVASASLLPVPAGLTPQAMRYFALFAGVIAALIVEPLPAAAVGFVYWWRGDEVKYQGAYFRWGRDPRFRWYCC